MLKDFINGDRGVFIRRLLRLNYGEVGPLVKAKFEQDPDFRRYVTDYMSQFDKLLEESKEGDPENVLAAAFLTSDVGKLYMVLGGILGRKQ